MIVHLCLQPTYDECVQAKREQAKKKKCLNIQGTSKTFYNSVRIVNNAKYIRAGAGTLFKSLSE